MWSGPRGPPFAPGASHWGFGGWEVKAPSLASSMLAMGSVPEPTLLQAGAFAGCPHEVLCGLWAHCGPSISQEPPRGAVLPHFGPWTCIPVTLLPGWASSPWPWHCLSLMLGSGCGDSLEEWPCMQKLLLCGGWGLGTWLQASGHPTAAFQDEVASGLKGFLKSIHLSRSIPESQPLPSCFWDPPPLGFSQPI